MRSFASTLRKTGSKSLKRRTRKEGAGKGEFAFTECRTYHISLAQNRGFCANEEPQAQKERKAKNICLPSIRALRRREFGKNILPVKSSRRVADCVLSNVRTREFTKM